MSARRRGGSPGLVHGLALIDKPAGPTSFSVARAVQRSLDAHKAGHGGTLDPLATGLLLVLLGEATKLTPWIQGRDKRYVATVRFGTATDTLDAGGAVVAEAEVPKELLPAELPEAAQRFIGDHMQRPPVYSALKVGGRTHMSRARAGEVVVVEPRPSQCFDIKLLGIDGLEAQLEVHVGSGYYVRALARDLGEALGVPAHLSALRRTSVGPWGVEPAVHPDAATLAAVVPINEALPDIPTVTVNADIARDVRHGKKVSATTDASEAMLLGPEGNPLAMVELDDAARWRVKRGFYLPTTSFSSEADSLIDKVTIDG